MQKIVMPDLVRLLARVGSRAMGDADLPVALAEASAESGASLRDGDVRATADGTASVALHVFNDTGDRDDGRALGVRRRVAGPREADDFRPLLLKKPGQAWLRIALEADAEAVARATHGALAARAEAGRNARLLGYRRHAPDEGCARAIANDLARFPSALSLDDVLALDVGDACVVQAEGRLSASASVSWSGLLSAAVPAIGELAGRDAGAFLVEVPADADASIAVSIEDGFSIGFARQHAAGDRAFRVVLQRHRDDAREAAAAVGIEAGFADPGAVARVVAGALAEALDAPADALRAIREATSFAGLPPRQRAVAKALAERLGIADSDPLDALRERLEDLDKRFSGRIEDLVGTRASLALEAEYRRLASDTVLLEAELSEEALRRLHPALLALDTDAVLADPVADRGVVSLLRDRVIERLRGWRIGVSLGTWLELESAQQREDRAVARRHIDADGDRTRREYLGATRYSARVNGWSTAYGATFEVVDAGDGAGVACSLDLWWEESRLRADAGGLARIVDDAVLWGVIAGDGASSLLARLGDVLHGVHRCRPRFELVLEGDAARDALARLAKAGPSPWAKHAARALPRNARIRGRLDCMARETHYGPAFAMLGDATGPAMRRTIAGAVQDLDRSLAARERKGDAPWTAWRVLRQAGIATTGFTQAFGAFANAASLIDTTLVRADGPADQDAAWSSLGDAFGALRPAFEQPFTLRTVAGLLADGPASTRAGARLELAYERGGDSRSLIVAGA